ncbi:hypothetical protein BH09BAC1_BH09BAC1_04330 [soil metagenome]
MHLINKLRALFSKRALPNVYYLGLPKTGSNSFAALFKENEALHEFWFEETSVIFYDYLHGKKTDQEVAAFLQQRDAVRPSRFDFATFNHLYANYLFSHKNSLFILPLRDAYSWANSLINHVHSDFTLLEILPWHQNCGKIFLSEQFDTSHCVSEETITANLDYLIPNLCKFWNDGVMRTLPHAPKKRTLVLSTLKLNHSIPTIARFLDIPLEAMNLHESHRNQGKYFVDYMGKNRELFKESLELYASPAIKAIQKAGIDDVKNFDAFVL